MLRFERAHSSPSYADVPLVSLKRLLISLTCISRHGFLQIQYVNPVLQAHWFEPQVARIIVQLLEPVIVHSLWAGGFGLRV